EQRRVAQVRLLARLDGDLGEPRRLDHGRLLGDAHGDRLAVLVELALPQQARHEGATQLLLRLELREGWRTLLRGRAALARALVQSHDTKSQVVWSLRRGPPACVSASEEPAGRQALYP